MSPSSTIHSGNTTPTLVPSDIDDDDHSVDTHAKVKVAIIGSGLAGLTAAYKLNTHPSRAYEVHLFEQAAEIGMDSASVILPIPISDNGEVRTEQVHIDVPMRSFQGGYYARLMALYSELGLKPVAKDFSYSFSYVSPLALLPAEGEGEQGRERLRTKLLHNGANGRRGLGLPAELRFPELRAYDPESLLKWSRCAAYNLSLFAATCLWLLVLNIYILLLSFPLFRPDPHTTLREWSESVRPRSWLLRWTGAGKQWDNLMDEIVVPLFSAVCTCSTEDVWRYPAEEILEYIYLTIGTHHYTVPGGSAAVIRALTTTLPSSQIHLSSAVDSLSHSWRSRLTALCTSSESLGEYDHVILATQPSVAALLLEGLLFSDSEGGEIRALRETALSVPQARAEVVTHTWNGLLPSDEGDERDLNLVTFSVLPGKGPAQSGAEKQPIMATHVVPLPHGTHPSQPRVFQTTNPLPLRSLSIPEKHVLSRTVFARAYVDVRSKGALEQDVLNVTRSKWARQVENGRAQGGGGAGVWLVGSWVGGGIPLLEGCVKSAELVVRGITTRSDHARERQWEGVKGQERMKAGQVTWTLEKVHRAVRVGWEGAKVGWWMAEDVVRLGWWTLTEGEEREKLKVL
ncbi:hypothetical protein DACRYDRAFT_108544 [Dacryopinax primogenitus]|uniref:FAD/NADP-binding domain-containing protein n=1 Tax=Dacryopinax primogenitus (strain DJM 731) TaxID=1858805 RepID=M5FZC8_DACPD|nr:uncharacterized protein DACRYDRAFT_108544 [Dacryopinax primogenitus]EJU01215.1 hypothetical protein DACRYDRAFT_108544 [Dacryopinax primogenitus]